jgi:hypothetical protein
MEVEEAPPYQQKITGGIEAASVVELDKAPPSGRRD